MKKRITLFVLVFLLSSLLQVVLGILNREAKDNHLQVVRIILNEHTLNIPVERCWECFQPKLYHLLGAVLIRVFSIKSETMMIITLQFVSVIAGITTIFITYKFLKKVCSNEKVRLVLFSLVAFNPRFIGVNAQATNDSLVIMLSVAAAYAFYLFLEDPRARKFFLSAILIVLASITKANALFLLFSLMLILFLKILGSRKQNRRKLSVYFALFLLLIIPATAFLGGYYSNYVKYGDPTKTNREKYPFPDFLREKFYPERRPGTTSVVNTYLTFRIIDLVRNPMINRGYDPVPKHRTSLWTQLYGRLNFVHFDKWPLSWKTDSPFVINLGRVIMVVALLPALVFVFGLFTTTIAAFRSLVWKGLRYFETNEDWVFLIIVAAYVSFIIVYSGIIRDFASMKVIFLFPGLLGFAKIFANGLEKTYAALPRLARLISIALYVLVLLYITDIVCLILQLAGITF